MVRHPRLAAEVNCHQVEGDEKAVWLTPSHRLFRMVSLAANRLLMAFDASPSPISVGVMQAENKCGSWMGGEAWTQVGPEAAQSLLVAFWKSK